MLAAAAGVEVFCEVKHAMIVCDEFAGDQNRLLKDAQHNLYFPVVGKMFLACQKQFIFASSLLDQRIEISDRVKEVKQFDHRVLQASHDIIAAYYRYSHDDKMQIPLLEKVKGGKDYEKEWLGWISQEIEELSDSPIFVRGVINAVVFQNNVVGYLGENQHCTYLVQRYDMKAWARPDGYAKIFNTPL